MTVFFRHVKTGKDLNYCKIIKKFAGKFIFDKINLDDFLNCVSGLSAKSF